MEMSAHKLEGAGNVSFGVREVSAKATKVHVILLLLVMRKVQKGVGISVSAVA